MTRPNNHALISLIQEIEQDNNLIEEIGQSLNAAISARNLKVERLKKSMNDFVSHQLVVHDRTALAPSPISETTGWPGKLDETITLSEREESLVEVLKARYPLFTTHEDTETEKFANHMAATVYRLRRKGVPIESAAQSREGGNDIPEDASGYRLIG